MTPDVPLLDTPDIIPNYVHKTLFKAEKLTYRIHQAKRKVEDLEMEKVRLMAERDREKKKTRELEASVSSLKNKVEDLRRKNSSLIGTAEKLNEKLKKAAVERNKTVTQAEKNAITSWMKSLAYKDLETRIGDVMMEMGFNTAVNSVCRQFPNVDCDKIEMEFDPPGQVRQSGKTSLGITLEMKVEGSTAEQGGETGTTTEGEVSGVAPQ